MINNQYMKNLVSYINENNTSINEAKDVNELKKIIQNSWRWNKEYWWSNETTKW